MITISANKFHLDKKKNVLTANISDLGNIFTNHSLSSPKIKLINFIQGRALEFYLFKRVKKANSNEADHYIFHLNSHMDALFLKDLKIIIYNK